MSLQQEYMMEKCDKLRETLEDVCQTQNLPFDMLHEYRRWFDSLGIKSEGEDGWPMDLVFDTNNIEKFAAYWNGWE